ncbi:hypothetical protein BSKO_08880 [Bryopsis sp. KO-2023]|nr:hypothetical protein BSKO_08880 [Bryopsis sp. KO-2023]
MELQQGALPLRSLNHISLLCKDVERSRHFYRDILGFFEILRPQSFDFEGCWLFGHGIGVHLIEGKPVSKPAAINPRSDHLSFQSDSLEVVKNMLQSNDISFVTATVLEGGITVSQVFGRSRGDRAVLHNTVFFHDPDNNMIEICNCDCLPVIPMQQPKFTSNQACGMCDPKPIKNLGDFESLKP